VGAEPNKKAQGDPAAERAKMRRMLLAAGAIAIVVVLAAVVAGLSGGGIKMSDGSNGTVDDPDLKEMVNGVRYRDIKVGDGEECKPAAIVKVNYKGWLVDGTEFDSSQKQGGAYETRLSAVVEGWQFGIPGMKVGGKRKLVISPDRGYGSRAKGKIPPGSTLIFEVELLGVKEPPAPATGPGRPMSDGSNGGTEDGELKEIAYGLKYRDIKEGSGESVKPGAFITLHYTGWTVDGNVFDTSKKGAGVPAEFELSKLIPGWQKGIPGMKPGGIRKLVVPPALGYGELGSPPNIPGNSILIFEVEFIR
jgi:peptidylprolyl isomerase